VDKDVFFGVIAEKKKHNELINFVS
jgi:hypothetical protein